MFLGSGKTNCAYDTLISTTQFVKKIGITIGSIGVGSNVETETLFKISTSQGNVFLVVEFDRFIEIMIILTENGDEIRNGLKYVLGTDFQLSVPKRDTIIVEETITKEVE